MKKVALVTGSTHNMGKATAEIFTQGGFHVIITSRHEDESKKLAGNLPNKGSYYALDFSEPTQIEGLFTFIKEEFGWLDVLERGLI